MRPAESSLTQYLSALSVSAQERVNKDARVPNIAIHRKVEHPGPNVVSASLSKGSTPRHGLLFEHDCLLDLSLAISLRLRMMAQRNGEVWKEQARAAETRYRVDVGRRWAAREL